MAKQVRIQAARRRGIQLLLNGVRIGLGLGGLLGLPKLAAAADADAPAAPAPLTAPQMQMIERENVNCGGDAKCHFDDKIVSWHVRGDIWLMVGEPSESNVVVQVGNEGVLVVDTGAEPMAGQLVAAIRQLAAEHAGAQKGPRWIINTDSDSIHIGGNEAVSKAGTFIAGGHIGGSGGEIVGNQNMVGHLVNPPKGQPAVPKALWPTESHVEPVYSWYFNDEAVSMFHPPVANTDGNIMVLFRQSDVVVTGDVLDMDTYPIIDVAAGGTIDGELTALNQVLELAVPQHQQDIDIENAGTILVPGHGRLAIQSDVQDYINMVTEIRNRVMYYKNQGKTLQQVLALKPSSDFDGRWGGSQGLWTANQFVEAVYNTLPRKGSPIFHIPNTPAGGG